MLVIELGTLKLNSSDEKLCVCQLFYNGSEQRFSSRGPGTQQTLKVDVLKVFKLINYYK